MPVNTVSGFIKALERLKGLKEKGSRGRDLPYADLIVYLAVYKAGTIHQRDLSNLCEERYDIDPLGVSDALSRLITRHKFIDRTQDDTNYRLNVLSITKIGERFVEDLLRDLNHDDTPERFKVSG